MKPNETIPQAIRRQARRDLGKALDELADPDAAFSDQIHDLRTAIKKVRALVRMVRSRDGAAKENRRLRKIARSVAPVRDAEVLLHTFEALTRGRVDRRGNDWLRLVRAELWTDLQDATDAFGRQVGLEVLGKRLARARRGVERWAPTSDRWRAIGPGLERDYDRGQRTMADAYSRMSGEAFHAWRRAVKRHRHQVHALLELAPGELRPRVDRLDRLGSMLGDEHDLTVLEAALAGRRTARQDPSGATERLLEELDARRTGLRSRARRLGERLFAEDGARFGARLRRAFRAFRKSR